VRTNGTECQSPSQKHEPSREESSGETYLPGPLIRHPPVHVFSFSRDPGMGGIDRSGGDRATFTVASGVVNVVAYGPAHDLRLRPSQGDRV